MELKRKSIVVTNSNNAVIAQLMESDGITNCTIEEKQNGECTLNFTMSVKSDKYKYVENAENRFIADNRVFTQLYDGDSVEEKKTTGNENTADISLTELQYLLDKQYVTAYNSTTMYDHIDTNMVVLVSGGLAQLNVNGEDVTDNPFESGSAGYALYAILYGTEWSVGIVDVEGTFDLESDKKSVLECIKDIADLWGGILIFDSFNRTVSLRGVETYKPYNGYAVRYRSNETSFAKTISKNIVTRLFIYGKDNLNIASATDGEKEYLEDYTYTSTPLYGLIKNNNLTTAGDLVLWGRRQLKQMCVPQTSIKVGLVDRSKIEGGISFEVNDMVDVIDEDLSEEQYRTRVVSKKWDYFQPWNVTVTLGDDVETIATKVKYALESADKVNYLTNLVNRISSDDINMSGTKQTMTSYVQLTNAVLEAGFKVIGVDGYERTGKTTIDVDGIKVFNGGIIIQDGNEHDVMYMDKNGNIMFSGNLFGASGTFKGALEAATGTFKGALQAATGSFSGEITAETGYIGGWTIKHGGIFSVGDELALMSDGSISAATGNFYLDNEGHLTARGADLTGSFSAVSEEGTSSFEVSDDTLAMSYSRSADVSYQETKKDENGNDYEYTVNTTAHYTMEITPYEFEFMYRDDAGKVCGIAYKNGTLTINGQIYADGGTIGGWVIGEDSIYSESGNMKICSDGTLSGATGSDGTAGKFISEDELIKTELTSGGLSFWRRDRADNPDTAVDESTPWLRQGRIYSNTNISGGLTISSQGATVDEKTQEVTDASKPIGFAVGGNVIMQLQDEFDENNEDKEDRLHIGLTNIYKRRVKTQWVDTTGHVKNITPNSDYSEIEYEEGQNEYYRKYKIHVKWDGHKISDIYQEDITPSDEESGDTDNTENATGDNTAGTT